MIEEIMAEVLNEIISPEYLQTHEMKYHEELKNGTVTADSEFSYAWCLVRSRYATDIRKGLILLQGLYENSGDMDAKRDYLFYLAVGNAKLKEYASALKFIRALLLIQPGNMQATEMEAEIKHRMHREGFLGMALAGGAVGAIGLAVAVGGIVGIAKAIGRR